MIEIKRKSQQPAQMPAAGAEMPLNGLDAAQAVKPIQAAENGKKRQQMPFTGIDASRDYRAMYADVFKYHERFNPPDVTDTDGQPGRYWWTAAAELTQLADKYRNDEFMTALLTAVYAELEREYKRGQDNAAN